MNLAERNKGRDFAVGNDMIGILSSSQTDSKSYSFYCHYLSKEIDNFIKLIVLFLIYVKNVKSKVEEFIS